MITAPAHVPFAPLPDAAGAWRLLLHVAATETRALCLIAPSGSAGPFGSGSPELDAYEALGQRLARLGVATLIMEMPSAGDPAFACRSDEICARQRRLLGLFDRAHREYPGVPSLVIAGGETALCAVALLRAARPETQGLHTVLAFDCTLPSLYGAMGEGRTVWVHPELTAVVEHATAVLTTRAGERRPARS